MAEGGTKPCGHTLNLISRKFLASPVPMLDCEPARLFEIELDQPLPTLSATSEQTGRCYPRAWCFVRLHSQPLGLIELPLEKSTLEPKEYVHAIWQSLSVQINEHLRQDGLPHRASKLGGGTTMAFTAEFLHRVGGFDLILGGNGLAQYAEDADIFFQVIVKGYQLVYTPAALVYHLHRRDYQSLRKQIYTYGVGLTTYLTKNLLENPHLLPGFVIQVPYGLFFALSARSPKNRKKRAHYPKELTKLYRKGMVYGPLAYLSRWWAMRKLRRIATPLEA